MGTVGAFVLAFFIYKILVSPPVKMVGYKTGQFVIGVVFAVCSSWLGLIFIAWFLHALTIKK